MLSEALLLHQPSLPHLGGLGSLVLVVHLRLLLGWHDKACQEMERDNLDNTS